MFNRLILWVGLMAVYVPGFGANEVMVVSQSDTAYYETFSKGLSAANKLPQAQLTLLTDVRFDGQAGVQNVKTNLTIDLNGYSIGDSLSSNRLFSLKTDSLTLRIISSRAGGRIHVAHHYDGVIYAVYCSKGTLELEGVTIEGSNIVEDIEVSTKASVRGVYAGAPCSLTMKRCEVTVTSNGTANALYAAGSSTSAARVDVHNCKLNNNAGKSSSVVYCFPSFTMDSCEIHAQAEQTVYGISIPAFPRELCRYDTARVTNTRIHASATSAAYGIMAKGNLYMANDSICTKTTYAGSYAFHANSDTAHYSAVGCTCLAESGGATAYGAYIQKGAFDAEDCLFSAIARQDTVQKPEKTLAYALAGNKQTEVSVHRCTLIAKGTNQAMAKNVYGVSMSSTTRLTMYDCDITAEGGVGTCGIRAPGDTASVSEVDIRRCTNTVRGKTKSYGIYMQSKGQVTDCKMEVSSDSIAYALYALTGCDTLEVRDCYLKVNAPKGFGIVNRNANNVGLLTIQGGYYTDDTNLKMYLPSDSCSIYRLKSGSEYAAGYRYTIRDIGNPGVPVAQVYETGKGTMLQEFTSLSSALWYAFMDESKAYTIVVTADCRLIESYYYIPPYVTLVIGYQEGQNAAMGTKPVRTGKSSTHPFEFARLVLQDGAQLAVDGVIEVSAVQKGGSSLEGCISGDYGYGRIHMEQGSSITLGAGARLRAWGYITGKGEITAQAGSAVYELLQIGEWKGGTLVYSMIDNEKRIFPITHFFYQNIEAPITYQAGAKAYGSSCVSALGNIIACDNIKLIEEEGALFVMNGKDAGTSVHKEYDPLTDRVTWTTNGDAALSELSMTLGTDGLNFSMLSSNYILPMSTNMTIRAASGQLTIENDVSLLPGARVEIVPGAQVYIPEGTKVYTYDIDDWGTWNDKKQYTITYSPSWTVCPRDTLQPSARIMIGGEILVDGSLYTTEHGAEIRGIEGAEGKVILMNQPLREDSIFQVTGNSTKFDCTGVALTPAMLMNADSTYIATQGVKAGTVFTYSAGQWTCPADSYEDTLTPSAHSASRIVLHQGKILVLTPDGQRYSLLGQKL